MKQSTVSGLFGPSEETPKSYVGTIPNIAPNIMLVMNGQGLYGQVASFNAEKRTVAV